MTLVRLLLDLKRFDHVSFAVILIPCTPSSTNQTMISVSERLPSSSSLNTHRPRHFLFLIRKERCAPLVLWFGFKLMTQKVLISRLYRTDFKCVFIFFLHINRADTFYACRRSIADVFRIQVVSNSDVRSPIITLGSTSFFHVRINNLYVVAVTKCVPILFEVLELENVIQNERKCCTCVRVLLSFHQHMQGLLWKSRRRSSEE